MRFGIRGVGLWLTGYPDCAAWLAGAPVETTLAEAEVLGLRNRRRASAFSRAMADAYGEAVAAAGIDAATSPTVFGSALGEVEVMLKLLDQMWREKTDVSPSLFSTSVHNAASGVVTIATKNHGYTTSLAADYDTPAMALMEAVGLVATTGATVVVTCADEDAPEDLVPDEERFGLVSAAVAIGPAGDARVHLSAPHRAEPDLSGADLPPALARNPQAGLLDLVDAVLRQRKGILRLDRGRGDGWCVTLS